MADLIANEEIISESIEMYLLRIAQLQQQHSPVPIPVLAQELSVSPVSANEMCRKLTQRQLITYAPYKGVTLTPQGATLAQKVLHHRRLWEQFLSEKLGMSATEAEDLACRFEHITTPDLAERLAHFLQATPGGSPIPLSEMPVGKCGTLASTDSPDALLPLGLSAGISVTLSAITADGTRLISTPSGKVSLSAALAAEIFIIPEESIRVQL